MSYARYRQQKVLDADAIALCGYASFVTGHGSKLLAVIRSGRLLPIDACCTQGFAIVT
jgi:hypothetical protein